MRTIALPDSSQDAPRRAPADPHDDELFGLNLSPAVRPSTWAFVLLVVAIAAGAIYVLGRSERADGAGAGPVTAEAVTPAPALATTTTPADAPSATAEPSVTAAPVTAAEPPGPAPAEGVPAAAPVREPLAASEHGRHEAALAAAEAALRLDPDDAAALHARGRALLELHRLEEAEMSLVHCVAVDPANAEAHNVLGLVLLAQGRSQEAIDAFEEAARLAPDAEEIRRNLERARERGASGAAAEPPTS